ncbi:unnamed protein product [Auanema sp. JU1783]|nr:unnamed protein product [Auanema sp. JU1783]
MVRSESPDDEVATTIVGKYEDVDEDDASPQSRWPPAQGGNGLPQRPHSRSASSVSPTSADSDRRLRRQIANCNERRRMQSINAGFQSLRSLLPRKEGEKLSKAAILQQTADLIHQLQGDRQRLMMDRDGAGGKKAKLDGSDFFDLEQRSLIDRLQIALERERSNRILLEQQINQLRDQMIHTQSNMSPESPQKVLPNTLGSVCSAPTVTTPSQASVIRPTPLPPISVDVSTRVSTTTTSVPLSASPLPVPPAINLPSLPSSSLAAISSSPSAFTTSTFTPHHSLQTILDAIRQLEGGNIATLSPPPPSSQAPLVR